MSDRTSSKLMPRTADDATRAPHGHRWLSNDALQSNVFFDPAILEPAFAYLAPRSARHLAARDKSSGLAVATAPVVPLKGRYGPLPVPVPLSAWQHSYSVNGTPLVSADDADSAIGRLLEEVQDCSGGKGALLIPMLNTDGPLWPALRNVLERQSVRYAVLNETDRAGLKGAIPIDGKSGSFTSNKARQSINNAKRKLRALGDLEHQVARSLPEISRALDVFFELEASGWKGRRGTALKTIGHDTFFRAAVSNLALDRRARIDVTLLDGNPVASTVAMACQDRASPCWMPWKTAYDERYTKQAPGTVNLFELTSNLVEESRQNNTQLVFDSLAGSDSVIASRLWPDRWHFIDLLIDLSNGKGGGYGAILLAERIRKKVRETALAACSQAQAIAPRRSKRETKRG